MVEWLDVGLKCQLSLQMASDYLNVMDKIEELKQKKKVLEEKLKASDEEFAKGATDDVKAKQEIEKFFQLKSEKVRENRALLLWPLYLKTWSAPGSSLAFYQHNFGFTIPGELSRNARKAFVRTQPDEGKQTKGLPRSHSLYQNQKHRGGNRQAAWSSRAHRLSQRHLQTHQHVPFGTSRRRRSLCWECPIWRGLGYCAKCLWWPQPKPCRRAKQCGQTRWRVSIWYQSKWRWERLRDCLRVGALARNILSHHLMLSSSSSSWLSQKTVLAFFHLAN